MIFWFFCTYNNEFETSTGDNIYFDVKKTIQRCIFVASNKTGTVGLMLIHFATGKA